MAPARLPSASDAIGLLPAHATAHAAMIAAWRLTSPPAHPMSSDLGVAPPIRHAMPTPKAEAMLSQIDGAAEKTIMASASTARTAAACRMDGGRFVLGR